MQSRRLRRQKRGAQRLRGASGSSKAGERHRSSEVQERPRAPWRQAAGAAAPVGRQDADPSVLPPRVKEGKAGMGTGALDLAEHPGLDKTV